MSSNLRKNYLGSYLVDQRVITDEQLEQALKYQIENKKAGKIALLGQTLVGLGFCTDEDITRALAAKVGVPYCSLNETAIDPDVAGLINAETAQRYQAIPLKIENKRLFVAMMHPSDIIAIDDLRIITGFDIQPVIVSDKELKEAIEGFSDTALRGMVSQGSNFYPEFQSAIDRMAGGEGEVNRIEEENSAEEVLSPDDSADRPAVQLANLIFTQAVRTAASDVHIEPQENSIRIRFRIDGVLHEVMQAPKRLHPSLVSRIKVMANMDIAERRIPQDGRITMQVQGKTIDSRVASMPTAFGEKLTLRLLDRSARLITLKELGFPEKQLSKFEQIMKLPYGFILVTGPTGSGKSTTLYSSLVQLNSVDKHILTLEDPIERRLEGVNQVQINMKAGMTFASGLRAALRNDPDIIMVGEIRDHETARIAVESALTGHLVLSTLHTNDSAGAITRLADMGIEPYLTASSLIGVVAQRLIRILCAECKEPYTLHRNEILSSVPDFPLEDRDEYVHLYRPKGCPRCSHTGYKGRRGVYEVLMIDEEIQKLVLSRCSAQEIKEAALVRGMISLRQDGLLKAREGSSSLEEVMRVIV